MTVETNKQTLRTFWDAYDRNDLAACRTQLAPGMTAYVNDDAKAMSADEFEGLARGFTAAFSDSRHVVQSQICDGDSVASRLVWSAVHTGDFNGIPASQRPVRITAMAHTRFVKGKIAEHRVNFDMMALMSQIGAIPAAA